MEYHSAVGPPLLLFVCSRVLLLTASLCGTAVMSCSYKAVASSQVEVQLVLETQIRLGLTTSNCTKLYRTRPLSGNTALSYHTCLRAKHVEWMLSVTLLTSKCWFCTIGQQYLTLKLNPSCCLLDETVYSQFPLCFLEYAVMLLLSIPETNRNDILLQKATNLSQQHSYFYFSSCCCLGPQGRITLPNYDAPCLA